MISIAMATYNGAKYIHEQIDSILAQTIQDFELVICDDCSTDDTWKILNAYASKDKRFRICRNERNLGFKKNFEKTIGLTKGEYIALSDQDDIWESNHLELLRKYIGNKMIACGDALMVNSENQSLNMLLSYQESLDYVPDDDLKKAYSVYYFRSPYQGAGMLIKRDFFKIALPIPEKLEFHDAWFSLLGCFYGGLNFFKIPISHYRRHDHNVTGNKIRRRYKLRTWFRHLRREEYLKDRLYVANQVLERVPNLSDKQKAFLYGVCKRHKRRKSIGGRLLNALFELRHYKLIFSCDFRHWI